MKKSYVLIMLFLIFIISVTIIGSIMVTGNVKIKEDKDILLVQSNKEVYFSVYGYSIDNPNVIVNPYGNSPLTALIMFETDNYSEVELTIKSKNDNDDIVYKFSKNKYHMIPVYGLYADYNNTVIIRSEGKEKVIDIRTDKLPEDFDIISNTSSDNFSFYNAKYPYAIDSNNEVRWYLEGNYYGNITLLEDSSIIIGSDRYDENGNSISIYKMSFLGKIYNEYLVSGSYYGYNTIYSDNLLVLSDEILLIDIQTGNVIDNYIVNDNYNYLNVSGEDIIVGIDNSFYKIIGNKIEEVQYEKSDIIGSFYNNTGNYRIISSSRFGVLEETSLSDEKITIFNYDKLEESLDIDITRDVNRIKIINSTGKKIYLIFDKFMDKRVYEVNDIKYISTSNMRGKYTLYLEIEDTIYKTDYYIEV